MSSKISALSSGATLAGTEPIPTVQSGNTVKVLVSAFATYIRSLVNVFSKNQSVTPQNLTSGASVSVDASLTNNFRLDLAHNATIANPTNLSGGMILNFRIKNTGTFTCAFGSKFKFPGGAPTISSGASKVDLISGSYDSTDDAIYCGIAQDLS